MLFLDLMPAEAKHFDGFYAEFELAHAKNGPMRSGDCGNICSFYYDTAYNLKHLITITEN